MKGVPALAKIILILLFVNVIDGAINHTNTNKLFSIFKIDRAMNYLSRQVILEG